MQFKDFAVDQPVPRMLANPDAANWRLIIAKYAVLLALPSTAVSLVSWTQTL
jgi:hypothetical protein